MKKTNKLMLLGFAIAILGSVSVSLKANEAPVADKDCSVVSTEVCTTIELPGGNTMSITGKPKPVVNPE